MHEAGLSESCRVTVAPHGRNAFARCRVTP
jgi:hypothetical protein